MPKPRTFDIKRISRLLLETAAVAQELGVNLVAVNHNDPRDKLLRVIGTIETNAKALRVHLE